MTAKYNSNKRKLKTDENLKASGDILLLCVTDLGISMSASPDWNAVNCMTLGSPVDILARK